MTSETVNKKGENKREQYKNNFSSKIQQTQHPFT